MMRSRRVMALGVLLLQLANGSVSAESPQQYLREALKAREALRSMILEATVKRNLFVADVPEGEELAGATFAYDFWISEHVSRVDCVEDRPKNPAEAFFQKYASSEGVLRVIPGKGRDMLRSEYDSQAGRSRGSAWIVEELSIAPQSIGFWPSDFALLKRFSPDDAIALFEEKRPDGVTVSISMIDEGEYLLLSGQTAEEPPSWKWSFRFHKPSKVPTSVQLTGFSGEGTVDAIETKWEDRDGISVPVNCRFTRVRKHKVLRQEDWSMNWISVNKPIPPSVATWESLGIDNENVVEFFTADGSNFGQWSNGIFRPWRPAP